MHRENIAEVLRDGRVAVDRGMMWRLQYSMRRPARENGRNVAGIDCGAEGFRDGVDVSFGGGGITRYLNLYRVLSDRRCMTAPDAIAKLRTVQTGAVVIRH